MIFLMSSEIAGTSSARSDEIVRTIQSIGVSAPADLLTFLVRKAAHICAYFILGILLFNLLKEYDLAYFDGVRKSFKRSYEFEFPKSRKVTKQGKPFGWVKLEFN